MEEMRLEGYRNLILGITNIRGATEIQDLDRSKRQFLRVSMMEPLSKPLPIAVRPLSELGRRWSPLQSRCPLPFFLVMKPVVRAAFHRRSPVVEAWTERVLPRDGARYQSRFPPPFARRRSLVGEGSFSRWSALSEPLPTAVCSSSKLGRRWSPLQSPVYRRSSSSSSDL
ncbi:hypothetical protein LINPERPRIM_LOCUS20457, partial [Linum perenne]